MKRKFLITFILTLALLLAGILPGSVSYAQPPGTGWIKYSANPALPVGADTQWDDGLVGAASVIQDGVTYKMWYSGYDGTDYLKIGYAESTNGTSWTNRQMVLDVGTGWEASGVGAPCVIKEDTTYKMWYTGIDASNIIRIGYAESTNGTTWTNRQKVMDPVETWEATGVGAPSVINDGGTYKMWYTGRTGDGLGTLVIGYAESTDGITWTDRQKVLEGGDYTWEDNGAGIACVIKNGPAKYDMWYTGYAGSGESISSDIGYATSDDGIAWTKSPNPALSGTDTWEIQGVAAPRVSPDGKYMIYTGIDADLQAQIGVALRLRAETSLTEVAGTGKLAQLPLSVVNVKDPFTGSTLSKTIRDYTAVATYTPAGIQVMGVDDGNAPFTTLTYNIDNIGGNTTFSKDTVSGAAPPIIVARPALRLVGSSATPYHFVVTFTRIVDTDNEVIKEQQVIDMTFQRGDVQKNGTVNITDAMYGAQYVVGIRALATIGLQNMASVQPNGTRDLANITDCMYIAQKVVGLRDANFVTK